MINFRYHVVSLTAVFLALAIGLVVGTAALNGPLADQLNDTVNGLSNHNKQLRDQVASMKEEVNRQEDFAVEAAPHILGGKLTGRNVALVALPGAGENTEGVMEMLALAGAKVTSRIDIQDKMTDPGNKVELLNLANDSLPPAVTNLPRNSDGVETSGALLAAVLLTRNPAVTPQDRTSVLTAYRSKGYIAVNGQVTGAADGVIVLAGTPYVDRDAAKKNEAVVTVVTQFDEAGPIVLAGTGVAGENNAIAEIRGDPALNKTISTVDNVQTAQGRIVTVQALVEQLRMVSDPATVKAGHYGIDGSSLMPKPPA